MRLDEARTLNPGLLRHQITYQRQVPADPPQNSYGEDQFVMANIHTVKAQIRELVGRELDAARQRWAEAQFLVTHWKVPGLELTDSIYWWQDGKGVILDLLSIADVPGTDRVLQVVAKERVP